MALKTELYDKLKSIGYQLGPFASKDTLSVVLCLHSVVMAEENINVAKLDDLDLRRQLTQHGLRIGPVTNHTRAIYQRKLLEVLTKQSTEGKEDPLEIDEPVLQTKSEKNTLYPNLFDTKPSSPIKPSIYSKKDEPSILRNNYKPAKDYTNNRNTFENISDIRSRLTTKPIDSKKITDDNLPTISKNSGGGTFLYVGIALFVAIIVFVGYLWFEK